MKGVLLCIGVPRGAHVGIDLSSWVVTELFAGIAGVPLNQTHLCSVRSSGDQVCGQAFLLRFSETVDLVVRQWDALTETLVAVEDDTELQRYRMGFQRNDFKHRLAAYPEEGWEKWSGLVSEIRGQMMGSVEEKVWFKLPDAPGQQGLGGEEVTKMNVDKSEVLLFYIRNHYKCKICVDFSFKALDFFIAKFQIAFLFFLIGESLEAFEEWKFMCTLLCQSHSFLELHPKYLERFVNAFKHQMTQLPDDFFVADLSKDNFITECIKSLREVAVEPDLISNLIEFIELQFDIEIPSLEKLLTRLNLKQDEPITLNLDDLETLGL